MKSSTDLLKLHLNPVDRAAARVAFFQGEHFIPSPRETAERQKTWRYPPDVVGTAPEGEPDWTGHRIGRMTAVYWWRPGRGDKPSVWITRCDCGNFEARVPGRWAEFLPLTWRGNDACEVCKDADIATRRIQQHQRPSAITKRERRDRWIQTMYALGLSVEEVASLIASEGSIDTNGLSAAEIRAQLQLEGQRS